MYMSVCEGGWGGWRLKQKGLQQSWVNFFYSCSSTLAFDSILIRFVCFSLSDRSKPPANGRRRMRQVEGVWRDTLTWSPLLSPLCPGSRKTYTNNCNTRWWTSVCPSHAMCKYLESGQLMCQKLCTLIVTKLIM